MKTTKKILNLCFIFLLIFQIKIIADPVYFSITDDVSNKNIGDTVTVKIKLAEAYPDLTSGNFIINYSADIMQFYDKNSISGDFAGANYLYGNVDSDTGNGILALTFLSFAPIDYNIFDINNNNLITFEMKIEQLGNFNISFNRTHPNAELNNSMFTKISTADSFSNEVFAYQITASSGLANQTILIYPNPYKPNDGDPNTGIESKGIIFENLIDNTQINIFDITGQRVFETRTLGNQYIWDTNNSKGRKIASGVYISIIKEPTGRILKNKIGIVR